MSTFRLFYHSALLSIAVGLAACDGGDDGGPTDTDTETPTVEPVCTEPVDVACVDQIISHLSLHDDLVSEGKVKTKADGADFVTDIDASAGGFGNETANPWVYVKFTETGAERVDIDDETALESMDWDLAARRFIVRLNGGASGPSCVGAVPFLEKKYEELTEVVADVTYLQDAFYPADCSALINDSSGLPGSPQVALSAWWEYPGCVATTKVPFQVQLADGHVLKLVVEQYYGTDQNTCNQTGLPGSDSGQLRIRWTYLQ
jgi:hypothetical protein